LADLGIEYMERYLEEIEFSLDMINYVPGRDLMEALLVAREFLAAHLADRAENDDAGIDEARMNEIIATIMTCSPALSGTMEEPLEELTHDLILPPEGRDGLDSALQEISELKEVSLPPQPSAPCTFNSEDSDILLDFIEESCDNLHNAEIALIKLEEEPENREFINEIFRSFHTIKGNSSFHNLKDINELSHKAQFLLDSARGGRIQVKGPCAVLAFESLDMIREMIKRIKGSLGGAPYESPKECRNLIRKLEDFNTKVEKGIIEEIAPDRKKTCSNESSEESARDGDSPCDGKKGLDQKVKVSTQRMDNLIDAVGELVIAAAMVFQEREIAETTNPRLARNISQMGKIVRELQEMAMSLRMVSLKATFQKMARIVRDLSVKTRVPVEFTFSGEDTELDRNVVEEIGNPLVHMVRNAVDHGIEPPGERKSQGKPERGSVHLSSYQEGGSVIIKLTDDGRGLNKEKILAKARKTGLVKSDTELTDKEIFSLIFHPGFSTADKVTDVSGRGVGMDVVKRNIDNLRGRIEITSEPGKGTSFIVRLPLTLAIIDGVVVRVSGEKYIIPTLSIIESIRAKEEQLATVVGKGEIFNIRGELLPLFRLHRLFELHGAKENPTEGLIVVLAGDGGNCALLVDELIGKQQVVIKSLDRTFKQLEGISGAAIMGDGRVALILDAQRIAKLSQVRN